MNGLVLRNGIRVGLGVRAIGSRAGPHLDERLVRFYLFRKRSTLSDVDDRFLNFLPPITWKLADLIVPSSFARGEEEGGGRPRAQWWENQVDGSGVTFPQECSHNNQH